MSELMFKKGNEVTAEALVRAGADLFCGYPITPSSEFLEYMSWRMPEVGRRFIQSESEIAAASMLYGGAVGGGRVVTVTSGPGLSLMAETLNFFATNRYPAVFVDVQRDAHHLAVEQSDYNYVTKSLGHHGLRGFVYAPSNLQQAVVIAYNAFDKAEELRTPVFLMLDGMLGQMEEMVELPPFKTRVKPLNYPIVSGAKGRSAVTITGQAPRMSPDESSEDASERMRRNTFADYRSWVKTEVLYDEFKMEDAEYAFISYGSSARISRDAVKILRAQGRKVGLFSAVTLHPFPERQIAALRLKGAVCVEMAQPPQFYYDVKAHLNPEIPLLSYARCGGNIVDENEAAELMLDMMEGK